MLKSSSLRSLYKHHRLQIHSLNIQKNIPLSNHRSFQNKLHNLNILRHIQNSYRNQSIHHIHYIQQKKNLANMKKDLPVLFTAGEADPVGNFGKGVKQAHAAFQKAGMVKTSIKLYPECRHEILNELNRQEVYADILRWIEGAIV